MPKKTDHRNARSELSQLAPEALQAITVRLPAGVLIGVHKWAEEKGLDLASAVRELISLGLETAARPDGQVSAANRKAVKKWAKRVEQALWKGESPVDPFLGHDHLDADLEALPAILAGLDYRQILQGVKQRRNKEPWVDRYWKQLKDSAASHMEPLMDSLDNLEKRFLARKKMYRQDEGYDGAVPYVHWLLSEVVMKQIGELPSNDNDVEAARQLIVARYLVAENPNQPWEFKWDE